MNIYKTLEEFPSPKQGIVLTIGNFDGVHKGHQSIIARALSISQQQQMPMVLMTFEPAPVKILCPQKAPERISPLAIKIKLLEQLGVQNLLIIKPISQLLQLSPEEFADKILRRQLNVRYIVEGHNFNFGHESAGNIIYLQQIGAKLGFTAIQGQPKVITLTDGQLATISSTLIRKLVQNSQLQMAEKCMGRPFILAGNIIPGDGRGHKLGFPTANLQVMDSDQLLPGDGVFAARARIADNIERAWQSQHYYDAALSIGPCPTFTDAKWQIEAHLLEFPDTKYHHNANTNNGNLQGKFMILQLYSKIRNQQKFSNVNELITAIRNDCENIRKIMKCK